MSVQNLSVRNLNGARAYDVVSSKGRGGKSHWSSDAQGMGHPLPLVAATPSRMAPHVCQNLPLEGFLNFLKSIPELEKKRSQPSLIVNERNDKGGAPLGSLPHMGAERGASEEALGLLLPH